MAKAGENALERTVRQLAELNEKLSDVNPEVPEPDYFLRLSSDGSWVIELFEEGTLGVVNYVEELVRGSDVGELTEFLAAPFPTKIRKIHAGKA